MDYPRTDDDWVNLAECIVMKNPNVSPERVGKLTVEATATIFSWYHGEERRKALAERQYARDDLMQLARDAGCASVRERAEEVLERISEPLTPGRPFPQTYSDWVNLAEDIKEKYPDDPVMRASVNFSLQQIAEEEQYQRPPDEQAEAARAANEAKRWFVERAREQGIA